MIRPVHPKKPPVKAYSWITTIYTTYSFHIVHFIAEFMSRKLTPPAKGNLWAINVARVIVSKGFCFQGLLRNEIRHLPSFVILVIFCPFLCERLFGLPAALLWVLSFSASAVIWAPLGGLGGLWGPSHGLVPIKGLDSLERRVSTDEHPHN